MPWTSKDAKRHTHLASSPRLQSLWSSVANSSLKRHGDEGRAIREANAAIHNQSQQSRVGRSKRPTE